MAETQYSDDDLRNIAKSLGIDPKVIGNTSSKKELTQDDVSKALGIGTSSTDTAETPVKITVRPKFNKAEGIMDQAIQGVPIVAPLVDKAVAGLNTLTSDTKYSENLKTLEEARKSFAEENPGISLGANVAGGMAAFGPLAATKFGAAMLGNVGPTMGIRALTGGASGAAIGSTDAALRGENPITGAGVGFAGGAAGPMIGEGVGKTATAITNYIAPKKGALKDAMPLVVNKLIGAFSGETPISIAESRKRLGPHGFLGDLNQGMQDITTPLAAIPGQAKSKVREAYIARSEGQRDRIKTTLDNAIGPSRDLVNEEKLITDSYKKSYDPLYAQFRSMQVHPTDEIKALIPRLKAAKAFSAAEELSGISGKPINESFFTGGADKGSPTTESWNYIKQGLDRRINQAYNAEGGGPLARELVKLKQEMMDEIGKTPAGKVWAQARNKFAEKSGLIEQLSAGKDTFLGGRSGTTVDELKEELKTLSKPEIMARIQGMRNAIDEAMNNTLNGDSTLRNKLLAPNNQEKIRLMLGNNKKADEIIATLNQEKVIADRTMNVIGNPNTGASNASRQEQIKNLMPEPTRSDWDLTKPMTYIPPTVRDQFTIAGMSNAWKDAKFDKMRNQLADYVTLKNGPNMDDLMLSIQNEAARQARVSYRTNVADKMVSGAIAGPGTTTVRRKGLPVE